MCRYIYIIEEYYESEGVIFFDKLIRTYSIYGGIPFAFDMHIVA
jgi:hypothetical protein